ncbi:hypothetical protein AMK26_01200 [Streptomyces sp. CB03234]|nr:hypothetical protein AMK26_01200 [Streptomyces sp. CB03234]
MDGGALDTGTGDPGRPLGRVAVVRGHWSRVPRRIPGVPARQGAGTAYVPDRALWDGRAVGGGRAVGDGAYASSSAASGASRSASSLRPLRQ